ncbi:MAG: hypothetical protein IJZ35_02885, partial [Clostridia bacterium]|nr:hypothetical protein [Clostridia bacterium]
DDDVRYTRYTNTYNGKNQLVCTNNGSEGYTTYYTYDLSGRLLEKKRSDGAYIKTAYDEKNLTTGVTYSFGGLTETASYTYNLGKDNALYETYFTDGGGVGTISRMFSEIYAK